MHNKVIITISRQFGSGGREIGQKLASELNIPFYDNELIKLAAKKSGIDEDIFENADEKIENKSNGKLGLSDFRFRFYINDEIPINNKLFVIQSKVIRELAKSGSCVIVGRCADFILGDNPNAVHVFVNANEERRLQRIIETYGVPHNEAKEAMERTDKRRATYYNYYTDGHWGHAKDYDLSIDSSIIGIDGSIKIIKEFTDLKLKEPFNSY